MGETYRFGPAELRVPQRMLLVNGIEVRLGARSFDLLVALVENGRELVSKDELLDCVWPGLVVGENNLPVQVANLRRVLGADAIATVAGRGYRFCLEIAVETCAGLQLGAPVGGPLSRLASTSNLPRPLGRFVGFECERAECAALLHGTRLLTLTGIGGAGKTRLAIEVARELEPLFFNRVTFIDLAPLADPDELALAVAAALGLREESGRPVEELLLRQLSGEKRLLLLDNCEHLVAACSALVERLLTGAPQLRVLATSRESLGVRGERTVAMRSMRVPANVNADLPAFEAIEFFVVQARQAAPEFELTPGNALAVVEICQRLDGIPLALELAAARVRLMTVEQIRDKLDDRFRLLTGVSKAHSRHQTLLATLDWSHDQLSDREQQLLRGLSVFSGGWTLAAAAAVAGAGDELEIADLLRDLVDRSLVIVERSPAAGPRYRLLETVRHFARDRLTASGAAAAVHDRHLAFFLALANALSNAFAGAGVKQAADALDAERANLLAAQVWCDQATEGVRLGLDLANALRRYWIVTGMYVQGRQFVRDALARAPATLRSSSRGLAHFGLGQLCIFMGQPNEARGLAEQAISIGRELGDRGLLVVALDLDRAARLRMSDFSAARRSTDEALAVSAQLADPYLRAIALMGLGAQHREEGDYPNALEAFKLSRDLLEAIGNLANMAHLFRNIAALYAVTGSLALARVSLAEAIRLTHFTGPNNRAEQNIGIAARLATLCGEWALAARIQGALDHYSDAIGVVGVATEPYLATQVGKPRAMLGRAMYALHCGHGRTLSLEAVTEEIMVWLTAPATDVAAQAVSV